MSETVKAVLWAAGGVYALAEVVLLFGGSVLWSVGTGQSDLGELAALLASDPVAWLSWALRPSWGGALTAGWASTVAVAYLVAAVVVAAVVLSMGRRREQLASSTARPAGAVE